MPGVCMKIALHWKIFICLCFGCITGILSRMLHVEHTVSEVLSVIGTLFIRALKMLIIPLVMSSIIASVARIGSGKRFSLLAVKTFTYYIMTSLCAILTGLALAHALRPGVGADLGLQVHPADIPAASRSITDVVIGVLPDNLFAALSSGDMLPIILFSLLFGFFSARVPQPYAGQLGSFFQGVFEVMMRITHIVMRCAPLGVFALVGDITARSGIAVFMPLGKYMLTVLSGLILHGVVVLPLLLMLLGRIHPLAHFQAVSGALMTAFSTASSAATLPLTFEEMEKNTDVPSRISGFVLPLGATINMDGTALYECVAALFIAQVYGIQLGITREIVVVITALLASIGAAAVPMAGLVMLVVVLRAVGLPLEGVGMILAVDRLLDMTRTAVNVWSDTCAAAIVAKSEEGSTGTG